jgi:hypothetical protein
VTGFPLRFVNLLVSGLVQSKLWMAWGYESLIGEIANHPSDHGNIDEFLCSLMEELWNDPKVDYPRLLQEWALCLGVVGWSL